MSRKILILGATGAMAVYLIPELLKEGYQIDGVSLDDIRSEERNLNYIQSDAKDWGFIQKQVSLGYDVIIDFMIYRTKEEFEPYGKLFMDHCKHYIFFSTYRIYADDVPLKETSRRLLDIEKPSDFVNEYEYSIYKAEEENVLNHSQYNHYTILRPAITYSKRRFQLTILEAEVLVYRMLRGKTVILPEGAMEKQATMSWAGDVAKMISALVLNPIAYRETYTVSTAEHHTWREIAEMYREIGNLSYITVPDEVFLEVVSPGNIYAQQQLKYDRCFDRIVDNSKILAISGLKQTEFVPLKEGLKKEFSKLSIDDIKSAEDINERMDEYLKKITN